MSKYQSTIFFAVLILIFGCDSNSVSFEDTIPLHTLTTTVTPQDGGTIVPSGGEFTSGSSTEIEARPAEGYVFVRWEGDLTNNLNPENLLFNSNRSVTAHFTKRDYDLNIEISGEGSVRETIVDRSSNIGDSDSLHTVVKLTAEADEGWYFDRWEGDLRGSQNPETITVDGEKNVTAIFDREVTDGYTITIEIEGEGSVERNPDRNYFVEGDEVILTAIADPDWNFLEWQGDLSGRENSQTIVVEGNIVATAVFGVFDDPFLEVTQQASTTKAGSPITPAPEVKLIDELGNQIEGAEITVTLNKNTITSGSTTSHNTNSDGIATFDNLIIEKAVSGYILSFATDEPDVPNVSSTPFEVITADVDPSSSNVAIPSENIVGVPTTITITLEDAYGNKISGLADDLSINISGANSATPSVSDKGSGEYSTSYTPTHAGMDQVTITLNGQNLLNSPYNIKISAGTPAEMKITQQPSDVKAGSKISSAPAVRISDEFGNALKGVDVSVDLEGGSLASGSSTSTETNSNGVAIFDNLVIHTAGTGYRVNFQANGLNKTSDSFSVLAASADLSASSVDLSNGVTGQQTTISITLNDSFGNGVSGDAGELSVKVSGANNFTPSVNETSTTGEYNAQYIPVSKGNDQVEINYKGTPINGSPFSISITAAPVNPSNSSISANPVELQVSESSLITVELRDDHNNPIGGLKSEDFDINLSRNITSGTISETSTAGIYEFMITTNSVGDFSISVSVNGTTISDSPVVSFLAGDPFEIKISIQPGDSRSGHPINGPPTVQVIDEFGNPIEGLDVRVREQSGYEFTSGNLVVATNSSGISEFNDLVITANIGWFYLVFSVDGLNNITSDRFRVLLIGPTSN